MSKPFQYFPINKLKVGGLIRIGHWKSYHNAKPVSYIQFVCSTNIHTINYAFRIKSLKYE